MIQALEVFINDKRHLPPDHATLIYLFEDLNLKMQKGVAVAVNDQVVPKSEWEKFVLRDQDKILMIQASQGG